VQSGQAWVIAERCIGCGNCLKVCAQNAKQVYSAVSDVVALLAAPEPVVAILAPTYAAAYAEATAGQVVAAVRALGFDRVMEVGFGAQMVAEAYSRLLSQPLDRPLISTACPALVSYVVKYMPELVPNLAPLVSPMVALGRAVKDRYLPGARVVFIGPCVAKKAEIRDPLVAADVDAALTFLGLQELFDGRGLRPADLPPAMADEPLPHFGALFPVSGGLLKAASIPSDLMDDSIVVVEGPDRVLAALKELAAGNFSARFLDALFCEGCIAGPAFSSNLSPLARKERVTAHVRELASHCQQMGRALQDVSDVDVTRSFEASPVTALLPNETELRDILASTNKLSPADELNCGACGYPTCREKAMAVYQGLAEQDMCLPFLIDQLQVNLEKLSRSKDEIERARELATRAEQMASMGRLTADIAHEISAPLSNLVVYAQLLRDNMADEDTRREDVANIVAEALHCREVLASLEGFARQREPQWQETHLHQVVAQALQELQPRLQSAGVVIATDVSPSLSPLVADPAQLAQVLVNLLTNGLEATAGKLAEIQVSARRSEDGKTVALAIRDNGRGIAPELLPRVFEPFVTTKQGHPGAGLGLAVAHGVIQAHGGDIQVESAADQGTTVTLTLPCDLAPEAKPEAIKVLVVDDDADFLEQHRLVLESMGFAVVTAERSDEALEVANREIPDAFVLDMMMERNDSGARLARALRRDPRFRRAPVIMLTSVVSDMGFDFYRNPGEVLEWMRADAWFDKPAPFAEMASLIRRHVAEQQEQAAEG
jgi:signal transduction histidine kinase/Fe-S-cluster-containing hydrogenase component 2